MSSWWLCLCALGNCKVRVCSHCSESILMTTFSCSLTVLLLSPGSPTIYLSNLQTNQLYVCSHRPRNYIDEIYILNVFRKYRFRRVVKRRILTAYCNLYETTGNLLIGSSTFMLKKRPGFLCSCIASSWTFWKVIGGRIFYTDWSLETVWACRFCFIFFSLYA